MRNVVADASVLLAFYLPAEPYKQAAMAVLKAFTEGRIRLVVPALAPYEFLNGLVKERGGLRTGQRLPLEEALAILQAFLALRVETVAVDAMEEAVLRTAAQCGCSAYDAAYLTDGVTRTRQDQGCWHRSAPVRCVLREPWVTGLA